MAQLTFSNWLKREFIPLYLQRLAPEYTGYLCTALDYYSRLPKTRASKVRQQHAATMQQLIQQRLAAQFDLYSATGKLQEIASNTLSATFGYLTGVGKANRAAWLVKLSKQTKGLPASTTFNLGSDGELTLPGIPQQTSLLE